MSARPGLSTSANLIFVSLLSTVPSDTVPECWEDVLSGLYCRSEQATLWHRCTNRHGLLDPSKQGGLQYLLMYTQGCGLLLRWCSFLTILLGGFVCV